MRIFVYLTLFVSIYGSAKSKSHPCNQADFFTSGVCVITNGYAIDPDMIDFAVDTVNIEINDKLNRDDNLSVLFGDLEVSVEYLEKNNLILLNNGVKIYRGLSFGAEVVINHIGKEGAEECLEHYYVLSHELLHVISGYVIGVSAMDNHYHNVENMFVIWARRQGSDPREIAEFRIYKKIERKCEEMYGEIRW